jgi:cysteine desulfurase/selenocysteine lyase
MTAEETMRTGFVSSDLAGGDARVPDHTGLSKEAINKDFPILSRKINGKRLVYLDSAATTQKPQCVIDRIASYYASQNANVHRGLHTLAEEATSAFEATRDKIASFIGGVRREEIIYTRNATEAINLVAQSWGRKHIRENDRIVITQMEHHANLVPWLVLAEETGAEIEYIPIDSQGRLILNNISNIIDSRTKIVALTQMSNVLGTINPMDEIIEVAHRRNAMVLIDGAQSVPHLPVDVKALDVDFMAFSAHKMLGPTGIGILYGRESLLDRMEPLIYGGEMISEVRYDSADWAELPWKFEAGTPNIAGAIGFAPALDYLNSTGMDKIREHEIELTEHALDRLAGLKFIRIYGPTSSEQRGGIISFVDSEIHPHDLAQFLDASGIAVRAGHHCAQPLMGLLGVNSTARASFYIYNTKDDIDELVSALRDARRYFIND